jgi:hypothetical protein
VLGDGCRCWCRSDPVESCEEFKGHGAQIALRLGLLGEACDRELLPGVK